MTKFRVKALINFNDKETQLLRNIGDEFYCDEERYEVLISKGAVQLVEIFTDGKDDIKEAIIEEQPIIEEVIEEKPKKNKKKGK